jgi:transketolase
VSNDSSSSKAPLEWTDVDRRAVDTIRTLAMDAVQKVGNGHPGTAMSLAPAAYLVYNKLMRHDPSDPTWIARDRFVLSCGHSSLTQYIQLYLNGFGMELEDLKALRTWGSATPGHPEYRHTPGVEVTTGPLGQGVGNAVGLAMAARRQHGLLDPDTPLGESIFDHHVYVIASDGDLQEGVSGEASSLAGHQQLGNLTLLWDDNRISIEDDTAVAFTEDVRKRYEAYGWHVQTVDWTHGGTGYEEDVQALHDAYVAARSVTDRPSFIQLRTIIGWPSPGKQNTGGIHGSALGADEVAATKKVLGADPEQTFVVDDEVIAHTRRPSTADVRSTRSGSRGSTPGPRPTRRAPSCSSACASASCPAGWESNLPTFEASEEGVATRKASGEVLTALAPVLPELWGGSADLAGSNNTTPDGQRSFNAPQNSTKKFEADWFGRVLHFGIREHGMGAVPQRDRAARHHPPLRRHLPRLQRLHAPVGAAGRADAAAGHVRVDPRLDRPRRGRPHAPAGRAPRRAARHSRSRRGAARRRQRDRRRLGRRSAQHRPAGRAGADAPGGSPRSRAASTGSHRSTTWPRAPTSWSTPTAPLPTWC